MKIGIDISQIVYEGTGVANYTKNLVENLLRIDKKSEYLLFGGSLRRQTALRQFTSHVYPFPPTLLDFLWNRLHIFPVENLIGPIDIFHSSDWTQPPTKAKKITTIHDLVVYKYPQSSHPTIIAAQKSRLKRVKKECDLIIVDSQATKDDCQEILGIEAKRLRVVYPGVNAEFRPQSARKISAIKKKYGLADEYVLAVGTREPRKNLARVIAANQEAGDTELVIAGKFGWGRPVQGAKILGFVPQDDLSTLYSGAKGFIYPSLYEGFGFPVLEAMACGCPVITSNVGSLPEVGGNVAVYVNPESVDDIAEAIRKIDRTQVSSGIAHAKKFSWEKTARETLKVYEELG